MILKEDFNSNVSSLAYSTSNYLWAKKNYYYIKELEDKNVLIDNKKTKLYIFEARYSEETPIAKYIQTGIICDNKEAYIITLALEKNNKNIERYEKLIWTFKCKQKTIK